MNSKNRKCLGIILAACVLEEEEERARVNACKRVKKNRSVWVKDWLEKREKEGFCSKLMLELSDEEPHLYRNFVRMTRDQFDYLLMLVGPLIEKQNTNFRKSIPALHRLALTLRYLATGESFNSLRYLFRIPQSTISAIIPEVLDAIYKVLLDVYLSVSVDSEITLFKSIYFLPTDTDKSRWLESRC